MRSLRYRGPERIELESIETPVPAPGEVLLKVLACGVCGTDVRIWKGAHRAYANASGRIPGHEIVGEVVESRASIGPAVGDVVFVAPNIGCGDCRACRSGNENLCPKTEGIGITRDGGFAEFLLVPSHLVARGNLLSLPAGVRPSVATLIEPLACVVRGQRKVAVAAGDSVAIAGAGPIGLLHVAAARRLGAARVAVAEPSAERRQAALRAGADEVYESLTALAEAEAPPSVIITAAPVKALQVQALDVAAANGRVLYFAGLPKDDSVIGFDTNILHYKELLVVGTTASTVEDCVAAAELLFSDSSIDWMITDELGLDGFDRAVELMREGTTIKTVLIP